MKKVTSIIYECWRSINGVSKPYHLRNGDVFCCMLYLITRKTPRIGLWMMIKWRFLDVLGHYHAKLEGKLNVTEKPFVITLMSVG
jgi:hypothetical protein